MYSQSLGLRIKENTLPLISAQRQRKHRTWSSPLVQLTASPVLSSTHQLVLQWVIPTVVVWCGTETQVLYILHQSPTWGILHITVDFSGVGWNSYWKKQDMARDWGTLTLCCALVLWYYRHLWVRSVVHKIMWQLGEHKKSFEHFCIPDFSCASILDGPRELAWIPWVRLT